MSRLISSVFALAFASGVTHISQAEPSSAPVREALECFPAENIIKFLSKFDKLKPEQKDTVDAFMTAKFEVSDDLGLPHRIFMRDQDKETVFEMLPDGQITDFDHIRHHPETSELCVEDPAREGLPREEDGITFNVDFDVMFKQTPGSHTLESLEDGAKDGKSFYKKLVPGPARLLIPKMTHVSITYIDPETPQNIEAWQNDKPLSGLNIEPFGKTYVVSLEQLEDLGATELHITGGPYKLEPSPSIKKMKALGFTEDDEN